MFSYAKCSGQIRAMTLPAILVPLNERLTPVSAITSMKSVSGFATMRDGQSPSRRLAALVPCLACLLSLWPIRLSAEGLRNPPPGAFNLGRAGGRIAQVDDSSAATQNPANLVDVQGREFQFTPSLVYMSIDYHAPSGASTHTIDPWKPLPNAFASIPLKQDKFAAGVGITVPYGLANEWDTSLSSPLRYAAPHIAGLKTINVNPSVAAKLFDQLSVGVGLDVMYSEVLFKQFLSPAFPDFEAKAKGDGFGFGGNIGITWQMTERQRLAVTYRSPITVDYDGHFHLTGIPGGGTSVTDFGSKIKFPTIVAVGYGIQLTPAIRVETDFEWLQFSRFDSLPINVGSNPFVPSMNLAQNWKDTFTAGIGGDWRFAGNWILRAGYQFYESPVPNSTFSPAIPDANQNVITVGLAYKYKRHALELAYGLDFYDQRHITNNQNPAFNGTYDINVHLFSLAYRYSF
jgi:long-chain fatty acid transport protein